MFSLICVWINGWVNNREAGDLRRYRAHFDVTEMVYIYINTTVVIWQQYSNDMYWVEVSNYSNKLCVIHLGYLSESTLCFSLANPMFESKQYDKRIVMQTA